MDSPQKTIWSWTVVLKQVEAKGYVVAIDPRDALSRTLTSNYREGKMVGEYFGVSVDVLLDAPGNLSEAHEVQSNDVTIRVRKLAPTIMEAFHLVMSGGDPDDTDRLVVQSTQQSEIAQRIDLQRRVQHAILTAIDSAPVRGGFITVSLNTDSQMVLADWRDTKPTAINLGRSEQFAWAALPDGQLDLETLTDLVWQHIAKTFRGAGVRIGIERSADCTIEEESKTTSCETPTARHFPRIAEKILF